MASEPGAMTPSGATDATARPARWGPGRIIGVLVASLLILVSVAAIAAGSAGIVLDQTQRDSSGYLMSSATRYSTATYALVSASYRGGASDATVPRDLLGTVRLRVSSALPVFIGIGRASAVDAYLSGVAHDQATSFATNSSFTTQSGAHQASPPTAQSFWSASVTGSGTHTVNWTPQAGNWRIVLMNSDGSRGVSASVSVGARVPHLLTIAIAVLGAGILVLLLSGGAFYLTVRKGR